MKRHTAPSTFQKAFDDAFSKPSLHTRRCKDLWADLEIVSDALAGPMYSALIRGNHDYVYRDTEHRFPGVQDEITFDKWAVGIANEYLSAVAQFAPKTVLEGKDKDTLLEKARAMVEIIRLSASEIKKNKKRSNQAL